MQTEAALSHRGMRAAGSEASRPGEGKRLGWRSRDGCPRYRGDNVTLIRRPAPHGQERETDSGSFARAAEHWVSKNMGKRSQADRNYYNGLFDT